MSLNISLTPTLGGSPKALEVSSFVGLLLCLVYVTPQVWQRVGCRPEGLTRFVTWCGLRRTQDPPPQIWGGFLLTVLIEETPASEYAMTDLVIQGDEDSSAEELRAIAGQILDRSRVTKP